MKMLGDEHMNFFEALSDYLSKNKRGIQLCLVMSAVFSVFLFYSSKGSLLVKADDLSLYGTSVIGGTLSSALIIFAMNANISLAPPIALSFTAILSIINDFVHFEQLENFSFGLLDMWVFRVFVFVWAIVSIIPRCFQVSHTVGVVIEQIDNTCGLLATIIIPISQVFGNFGSSELINAAGTEAPSKAITGGVIIGGLLLIPVCFMYLVALLTGYIFINTFVFFIDVVMVPFCSFIPLLSSSKEIIKAVITFIFVLLGVFFPEIYLIPYLILLIISIIFFGKAYKASKYFAAIYVKPLFSRIAGYKNDIPLIKKHIPKKVLTGLDRDKLQLAIPVYAVKKRKNLYIKNHAKWWFIVCDGNSYLRKAKRFSKKYHEIPLINQESKKVFIKKSFRFFEIFTLESEANLGLLFRKVKKDFHFVYSKEYFFRFNEIKDMTGFTDYSMYKRVITDKIKLTRQEQRELRRQERLEMFEERRIQSYLENQAGSLRW